MSSPREIVLAKEMPKFTWVAQYVDGSVLREFDNGTQHLFREIDEEKLEKFIIEEPRREYVYSVNVKTGEFNLNGLTMFSHSLPKADGTGEMPKYRLIWFKRVRKDFTPKGINTFIQYVLGLQATVDEKNYQQLVWVQDDGSVIINGSK